MKYKHPHDVSENVQKIMLQNLNHNIQLMSKTIFFKLITYTKG